MPESVYEINSKLIASLGFIKSNEDAGAFNQAIFIRVNEKLILDDYGILHYYLNNRYHKGFDMFTSILSNSDFDIIQ